MSYISTTVILATALGTLSSGTAWGQVHAEPDGTVQRVFSGEHRNVAVRLHNLAGTNTTLDARIRLLQTGTATAVHVADLPWKRIQVLPGQTVVESAAVTFPAVRAETRFLIQWVEGASNVLGRTEVLVYPTNLLQELKTVAGEGENALGLFDPENQLKPLLKGLAIEFSDLEKGGLETFRGKLAIIGPFAAKARMREGLPEQIEKLARKGVAIVWLQPPADRHAKLQPSFYTVSVGTGAVVVAQAELVTNLSANPQSQLNLIHCARLALHPKPPLLPHLNSQP